MREGSISAGVKVAGPYPNTWEQSATITATTVKTVRKLERSVRKTGAGSVGKTTMRVGERELSVGTRGSRMELTDGSCRSSMEREPSRGLTSNHR